MHAFLLLPREVRCIVSIILGQELVTGTSVEELLVGLRKMLPVSVPGLHRNSCSATDALLRRSHVPAYA